MGMETSSAQIRRTACGFELWPGLDVKPLDLIVDKTRFGAFVAEVTGPKSVVHHSNFQPLMTEMGQPRTFKMSAACPLPTRSRPNRRRLDTSVSGHHATCDTIHSGSPTSRRALPIGFQISARPVCARTNPATLKRGSSSRTRRAVALASSS